MTPRTRGLALLCGAVVLGACSGTEGSASDASTVGAPSGGSEHGSSASGGTGQEGAGPSDGGVSTEGGAGGADQDSSSLAASYYVPVPAELSPWATYPVGRVRARWEGDEVEIRYGFPRWLSGNSVRVVLTGVAPEGVATFDVSAGELGTGTCTRDGARFECAEILPGLEVDRDEARDQMADAGLTEAEIEKRLQVTDTFAVDPIGVLTFELGAED